MARQRVGARLLSVGISIFYALRTVPRSILGWALLKVGAIFLFFVPSPF
jgi:hypothetical protein